MGPLVHADVLDLKPHGEPDVRRLIAVGSADPLAEQQKVGLLDVRISSSGAGRIGNVEATHELAQVKVMNASSFSISTS